MDRRRHKRKVVYIIYYSIIIGDDQLLFNNWILFQILDDWTETFWKQVAESFVDFEKAFDYFGRRTFRYSSPATWN